MYTSGNSNVEKTGHTLWHLSKLCMHLIKNVCKATVIKLNQVTVVRVENFFHNQLKKLLGYTSLINSLFPFKLHVELFLKVNRVVLRCHFKLGVHKILNEDCYK